MKHVVILGGGISGLSLAWYLKKQMQEKIHLTVLEKRDIAGGWMQTVEKEGFLFEAGPHSCRADGGINTLRLVEDLGLQDQVITPSNGAKQRYLFTNNKLQALPDKLLSLFFSPYLKYVLPALWKDLRVSANSDEDESIYSFSERHFGKAVTEQFIDPLTTGIYAGDPQNLSVRSCFPLWHALEKKHGSILRGLWNREKKSKEDFGGFIQEMLKYPLFSFQKGMATLPREIAKQLGSDISISSHAAALRFTNESIEVFIAGGRRLRADHVFSTIPAHALADLIAPHDTVLGALLTSIESNSIAVVCFGYRKKLLKQKGFGYLIPKNEKEKILGMIWDSSIFPQQNNHPEETRLTVMLGGSQNPGICGQRDEEILELASNAVLKHLGITDKPDALYLHRARNAIPQYRVGHASKVKHIENDLKRYCPLLTCTGNSFYGISINDCISQAEIHAKKYCESVAHE